MTTKTDAQRERWRSFVRRALIPVFALYKVIAALPEEQRTAARSYLRRVLDVAERGEDVPADLAGSAE